MKFQSFVKFGGRLMVLSNPYIAPLGEIHDAMCPGGYKKQRRLDAWNQVAMPPPLEN
jgi:hypothetical protein